MAKLLKDPVDRYRALNLVLDVAGSVEDMDAPTIAMFKRFQAALLTMAREWRDPDLEHGVQKSPVEAQSLASANHDAPQSEAATAPESAVVVVEPQETAA